MKSNNQGKLFSHKPENQATDPVECLGLTFPNDEKRREYFFWRSYETSSRTQTSARSRDSPSARMKTSWRCPTRRTTPPVRTRLSRTSSATMGSRIIPQLTIIGASHLRVTRALERHIPFIPHTPITRKFPIWQPCPASCITPNRETWSLTASAGQG